MTITLFFFFVLLFLILEMISFKKGNELLSRLINPLADYVNGKREIARFIAYNLRITFIVWL